MGAVTWRCDRRLRECGFPSRPRIDFLSRCLRGAVTRICPGVLDDGDPVDRQVAVVRHAQLFHDPDRRRLAGWATEMRRGKPKVPKPWSITDRAASVARPRPQ